MKQKGKATGLPGGSLGGFLKSSEHPGIGWRINLSIAAKPEQSSPQIREVFPLHKERGGKRFIHQVCKAVQANDALCDMSLRTKREPKRKAPALARTGSLGLVLLDLKVGHFSFVQGLTGVYP